MDVHPEVSHYLPSPPYTVARCAAKAHPALATLWGAYLGKGRGQCDGGWHVSKLCLDVEWNGCLFSDPQKHVQGVKNAISGTVAVIH